MRADGCSAMCPDAALGSLGPIVTLGPVPPADEAGETVGPDVELDVDVALRGHADRLASTIEQLLAGWVVRSVVRLADAWRPGLGVELAGAAEQAGRDALADVGPRVRELLATDVDHQRTGPLDVCRSAVRFPAAVLAAAGVPPVERDEFAQRVFPDDVYGLSPANFAEIDESLAEPGLVWGAAKAHVVLARRKAEGRR